MQDKFIVNFAYGRRGSTLNTGTKTATPVDLDQATKIFTKLVNEKKAKGYTEGENGTPYQHSEKEAQVSGLLPQLLNPIDEDEVDRLINDPTWCMQVKMDGKRILLQKQGAAIHGINRKGLLVGLPSSIIHCAAGISGDLVIDGECVGDVLYAFDLLMIGGESVNNNPYRERLALLSEMLEAVDSAHIALIQTAYFPHEKAKLRSDLQSQKKEGVVFKRLDAPYTPGRPNTGGTQLKHKFYATASFIVASINAKRSVALQLWNGNIVVPAGNVTIPSNQAIPEVGAIIEARYLYAFKESGSVYQPTYLGVREDIHPVQCTVDQLKYRASDADLDDP
jgi:bifunctional non-homologous end joining protein LigD